MTNKAIKLQVTLAHPREWSQCR